MEYVKQCFAKTGKWRYKFPKPITMQNEIIIVELKVPVYDKNGIIIKRQFGNIVPRQRAYDIYTNSYCPIISKSKLACNSNVSLILNKKINFYVSKYISKDTQKDDKYNFKKLAVTNKVRTCSNVLQNAKRPKLLIILKC